jgi:hypothetical protein
MPSNWKDDLNQFARNSRAHVLGLEKVVHFHHGKLIRLALEAFGDDPACVLFIEILPPSQCFPRPDLIIIHPLLGVLVIENKGIELHDILRVQGHTLTINRGGMLSTEDPFHQAERVMFTLKDLIKSRTDQTNVLFNRMVSLPAIERADFGNRLQESWGDDALFAEDFRDANHFRSRLISYCNAEREKARRPVLLTTAGKTVVIQVLQNKGVLYTTRNWEAPHIDAQLLGGQIQTLESTLKTLTPLQQELMKLDVRGQHRLFRGVAGSGKSLLLAALAARLMVKTEEDTPSLFSSAKPPLRVLAVCFNKTLVHHLRSKIEEEYRRLAWRPPEFQLPATVTHFDGLLRLLGQTDPSLKWTESFDINTDRPARARAIMDAIDRLDSEKKNQVQFDAIFLDEAQDFEHEEIQLLLKLARRDEAGNQTFVIFYDNAQNIYGKPLPTWESLGIKIVGRTVFMDRCMRNTRQTIELAFNVLVGSFAAPDTRVATRRFADVQSLRQRDLIVETDDRFSVAFTDRNGPPPEVKIFSNGQEEREYTLATIRSLWRTQKVLPSDILVLYCTHKKFEALKAGLFDLLAEEYSVHSVGSDATLEKNLPLLQDRTLTLSTVHSAKGYDAPVVILVGADLFTNDIEGRAAFYVAATRAKLKLYVFGVKSQHQPAALLDEIATASAALHAPLANGENHDRQK